MQVKLKRVKSEHNQWKVEMKLTAGAILSIKNCLSCHPESPVGQDVLSFLNAAIDADAELKGMIG